MYLDAWEANVCGAMCDEPSVNGAQRDEAPTMRCQDRASMTRRSSRWWRRPFNLIMATSLTIAHRTRSNVARILVAGLITGVCDISFANATFFVRRGTPDPMRVFQSVASGLLGPPSYEGGVPTALLGAALHFLIAIIWTTIFVELERRNEWVRSAVAHTGRALAFGYGYGMFIWLAMNFVVIPLSQARVTPPSLPVFWVMLFGHGIFVGIPIVMLARNRVDDGMPVRSRMRSGARAIE